MPVVVQFVALMVTEYFGATYAVAEAIGAVVAYMAEAAALSIIARAISPKTSAPSLRAMATQVNVRDPAAPRQIIYGQRRVSGVLYPVGTSGTNNEFLHLILLIAGHECQELGDVTFNDQVVPLDGSGNATGTYAGFVRIKKHLGTYNQTVDTDLQSDLGSGYWTNACKGGGCAYLYIRLKISSTLFPGGVPEIYCLVKGRKLYNPGDISHSDSDPTTWTWSQNAALVTYDWVRGVRTQNSTGTLIANYGVGASAAEVDEVVLEDSANNCEEMVVLADASTEHRYYSNGTLLTSVKSGDGLDLLKSAMAGDCVFSGGKWLILSGYYRTPTLPSFGDSDLRAPLTGVRLKPALADLCNVVTGVYISADNAWQPADLPQVKNATYRAQDGDEDFPSDVEFQFTTSSPTGQRLSKVILERSRQGISFVAKCKLGAWRVRPGDVILWTDSDFGWSSKPFEVLGVSLAVENDANGQPYLGVDLTLKETASGVWDWANGEETTVDLAPNTSLRSPFAVAAPTGLTLTVASFRQGDRNLVPQLKVSWTSPADAYVTTAGRIRIQYKKHTDSDWSEWSAVKGDQMFDFILALVIGTAYDVQIRSENQLDQPSAWVQSLNFTMTADTTPPAAVGDLAATVGTGKSVSLAWTANTEADFAGSYNVYRGAHGGSRAKIATIFASRFVDVNVTLGTSYDWDVRGLDQTGNEASVSNVVNAIPTTVATGSLDHTVPSDPTAATQTGSGCYLSTDGTAFSYEQFSIPAMPAGAAGQNFLMKVHADSQWVVVGQYTNNSTMTGLKVRDLTPGQQYDFATEAYNAFGDFSNVVATTGNPFTAPPDSTAPAAPTSLVVFAGNDATHDRPPPRQNGGSPMYALTVTWTAGTSTDVAFYEFISTASVDTDAAADFLYGSNGPDSVAPFSATSQFVYIPSVTPPKYLRMRAVDYSGNRSAWAAAGIDISSKYQFPTGDMITQNAASVVVGALTVNTHAVTVSAPAVISGTNTGDQALPTKATLGLDTTDAVSFKSVSFDGSNAIRLKWNSAELELWVDTSFIGNVTTH